MNTQVRINGNIHEAISHAIRKALNEDTYQEQDMTLNRDFNDGLLELGSMYHSLKGFIGEYTAFVQALMEKAEQLGLKMTNFVGERYFELEEAMRGNTSDFEFDFVLPGAEQEVSEEKLYEIYDQLEDVTNRVMYGNVMMYTTDDGIRIFYRFQLKK